MASITGGIPGVASLTFGWAPTERLRLVAEAGGLSAFLLTGSAHVQAAILQGDSLTLYTSLMGLVAFIPGIGYDEQGRSSLSWGVGPQVGLEHMADFGLVVGADVGVLIGDWDRDLDRLSIERWLMPQWTFFRIGYGW